MLNKAFRTKRDKELQRLLPRDRRFCKYCNQTFNLRFEMDHYNSPQHKHAVNGYNGMRNLATELWEQHRGAPRDQEISERKEREIIEKRQIR